MWQLYQNIGLPKSSYTLTNKPHNKVYDMHDLDFGKK